VVNDADVPISPEPSPEDREAVLAAMDALLRREAELARPSLWRTSGWMSQGVGIDDVAGSVPAARRWPLSSRLPWGGRLFPGLNGRGDAK